MLKYDVDEIVFKGFMAHNAQANWNVIRIIYGAGDPTVKMVNKDRTSFFH
jgi:hypothetical protein